MKIAVTGTPGTGKTTLCAALAAEFGMAVLTSGDVAREVDPECIAEGRMADPVKLKAGVEALVSQGDGWVLDGYPRTKDQLETLSDDVIVILLTCRPDIATDRLLRRGRKDDLPEIIERRITRQTQLLEVNKREGWAFQRATWRQTMNTSGRRAVEVAAGVSAFLRGEKREIV